MSARRRTPYLRVRVRRTSFVRVVFGLAPRLIFLGFKRFIVRSRHILCRHTISILLPKKTRRDPTELFRRYWVGPCHCRCGRRTRVGSRAPLMAPLNLKFPCEPMCEPRVPTDCTYSVDVKTCPRESSLSSHSHRFPTMPQHVRRI